MYTVMLFVLACSTSLLDNDVGVILIQHYVIYAKLWQKSCAFGDETNLIVINRD